MGRVQAVTSRGQVTMNNDDVILGTRQTKLRHKRGDEMGSSTTAQQSIEDAGRIWSNKCASP
jgi:hypothetical protein